MYTLVPMSILNLVTSVARTVLPSLSAVFRTEFPLVFRRESLKKPDNVGSAACDGGGLGRTPLFYLSIKEVCKASKVRKVALSQASCLTAHPGNCFVSSPSDVTREEWNTARTVSGR